jgi:hypothetical protein
MDKHIKQLWVEALRSGDYEQGQNWLRYHEKFCCLGVLCDIYLSDCSMEWKLSDDDDSDDDDEQRRVNPGEYSVDNNTEMLPVSVAKWAGIDPCGDAYGYGLISVMNNSHKTTLTHLNDGGLSFAEIASIIEECL